MQSVELLRLLNRGRAALRLELFLLLNLGDFLWRDSVTAALQREHQFGRGAGMNELSLLEGIERVGESPFSHFTQDRVAGVSRPQHQANVFGGERHRPSLGNEGQEADESADE